MFGPRRLLLALQPTGVRHSALRMSTTARKAKDGLSHLVQEHNEVKSLFKSFDKKYETKDYEGMKSVMKQIILKLSKHSSAEEQLVYDLIRKKLPQGEMHYNRNTTDEQVNKEIMALLETMDPMPDADVYHHTVQKLRFNVEEHMSFEEPEFDALRSTLSQEELAALYDKIESAEARAPSRPHPEGPNTPWMSAVMHPIVGAVDKAVTAMTGTSRPGHPSAPDSTTAKQTSTMDT